MLRVQWMFEVLLQMNERARSLNQPLEEIRVWRFAVEPKLFKDIVRVIVLLFIPAPKKREVIRVSFHVCLVRIYIFSGHFDQPM